jgi:hypothetical protein
VAHVVGLDHGDAEVVGESSDRERPVDGQERIAEDWRRCALAGTLTHECGRGWEEVSRGIMSGGEQMSV